ncbi:MAG: hypothetical protein WAX80_02175 [Minisyncoccia bacterium]
MRLETRYQKLGQSAPVTREMVNELWDRIGIFPWEEKEVAPSLPKVDVMASLTAVLRKNQITTKFVTYETLLPDLVQWAADVCRQSQQPTR